jgi:hypothetical protein
VTDELGDPNSALTRGSVSWRRIFVRLVAVVASFAFAAVLLELGLRIFAPQREAMRWFESSPRYGYVLKTNFSQDFLYPEGPFVMEVRTNSFGHRDEEYDRTALSADQVTRVLFLGDSFLFGHGVNVKDRFDHLLETRLKSFGQPILLINSGVGAWGTLQEVTYGLDHLKTFNPDAIVLAFCGNDPRDDTMFLAGLSDNDRGLLRFPGKRAIKENLHLYRILYSAFHGAAHSLALRWRLAATDKVGRATLDRQSASLISKEEWDRTLSFIENLRDGFVAHNPNGQIFVLATAPANVEIRRQLGRLSSWKGIRFVDLYDQVKDLSDQRQSLPFDGHWSLEMHDIVANGLYPVVSEIAERKRQIVRGTP